MEEAHSFVHSRRDPIVSPSLSPPSEIFTFVALLVVVRNCNPLTSGGWFCELEMPAVAPRSGDAIFASAERVVSNSIQFLCFVLLLNSLFFFLYL